MSHGRKSAIGSWEVAGLLLIAAWLAAPCGAGERLQPADLQYLGAFRLPPATAEPPAIWEWSGQAMAFFPGGDPGGDTDGFPGSLFATGLDTTNLVAEISIPAPVIASDPASLPRALELQPFADVRGGLFDGLQEIPRVGIEYLPAHAGQSEGLLYLAWGQHFQDEPGVTLIPSHAWCRTDLANPDTRGAWWVGTQAENAAGLIYGVDDYLFAIPPAWASQYTGGGALATGRYRDGGWSGMGPNILAIAPWLEGSPAGAAPHDGAELTYVPLLRYSVVGEGTHRLTDYSHADSWNGAAWVTAGARSAVIFAGTKGAGYTWYGFFTPSGVPAAPGYPEGAPCVYTVGEIMCTRPDGETPCTTEDMAPCTGAPIDLASRGWWASRFDAELLFYDPDDLAAVAAGTMEPWQPQPYAVLDVDSDLFLPDPPADAAVYVGTGNEHRGRLGAMAYDRTSNLLYALELFADTYEPVVHVWRVAATATPPPVAEFTWTPSAPVAGQPVQLTDTSAGTVDSRQWSFGDGGTSTASSPTHTWSAAGSFSVTLNVTGPGGSDAATHTVVVGPAGGAPPITDPGSHVAVVPAAAHAQGLENTTWVTDLELHNPSGAAASANLYFLAAGADNRSAQGVTVSVPANGSLRLEDVVGTTFGRTGAVGAVLVGSATDLIVASRTFNDAEDGTFGQMVPGVPEWAALSTGERARLVLLTRNAAFRTNIGFANFTDAALEVHVALHDGDGTALGAVRRYALQPFGQYQSTDIIAADADVAWAEVWSDTPGASYAAYASVVDNASGDPALVTPVRVAP